MTTMSTFKRRKPMIYLAGGMERAPGYGIAWRSKIEKWLVKNGWIVHNPCTKETNIFDRRGVKASTFSKLKNLKTLDTYKSIGRDLIKFDLDIIDKCDVVLCYWDEYVSGGTLHEIGHAYHTAKIPVIIMSKLKLKKIFGWCISCSEEIFFNWSDVKKYISGGKYANRITGRGKKRKRHSSKRNTGKVPRKKNVVRIASKNRVKANIRLVG